MIFVFFVNGLVMVGMGILMLGDAALFSGTRAAFVEGAALALAVGGLICLATSNRREPLDRLHSFLLTGTAWITAAATGSVPLWEWGLTPTDAFFESMSGITTTGSTVMTGLDTTAKGILLWRALLQWLGGVGFIVAGIALLPIMRVGGMQLFQTESSEKGEKALTSSARIAAATIWVYVGLTGLCAFAYVAGDMTGFEAVVHALTTVSTGGYSTSDSSFGLFQSAYLQWAGTVFMLAGGLPFVWYIRGLRRGAFDSEQVKSLLSTLAAIILLLTLWLVWTSGTPILDALRLVAFNVVSVVTTTGYATTDYTVWGSFAATAFLCLTVMGGCTGSTAGGVKMMRWIIFMRSAVVMIKQIASPHGVYLIRYEGRPVSQDVLSGVMAFFFFYAMTILALAIALGMIGLDMATSLSGALTAVTNVGPGIGDTIGPAGNFSSLPDGAKWILILGMYVGRLEMFTVFVLMTPTYWREML